MRTRIQQIRPIAIIALCVCTCFGIPGASMRASAADSVAPIGPGAAWQPGMQAIRTMREACTEVPPGRFGDCLISEMPKAGAPPAAVAFTRRVQKQMGQIVYATNFRKAGKVDIVHVEYLLRANENQGWLLVNGTPAIIDVDDIQRLSTEILKGDRAYAALAQRYPHVMLFPDDRSSRDEPRVEALSDGGERFVVRYRLQDGCHACARVGSASFAFDFDQTGRFIGTRLLSVD